MSKKKEAGFSATEARRLGATLRQLREEACLSIATASAEIGASASHLSRIELGKSVPTVRTLARLAKAFGVTLSFSFKKEKRIGGRS